MILIFFESKKFFNIYYNIKRLLFIYNDRLFTIYKDKDIVMGRLQKHEKNIPIAKGNLVDPFLSLHNEVDKAMDELSRWLDKSTFDLNKFDNLTLSPAIDFVEDDKMFRVEAEMPGMGEKDINISIDNHMLTISGEKSTSKKNEDKNYRMREISYGKYERSLTLPENLDIDNAKATFKKGMLWVEFPKMMKGKSKPKKIDIKKIKE